MVVGRSVEDGYVAIADMRRIVRLAGSDFEGFFQAVAVDSAQSLGADAAALIVQDADGMMQYRFFYGSPDVFQRDMRAFRFSPDSGTVGAALREERMIFTPDYAASPNAMKTFVEYGLQANLVVPVQQGDGEGPQAALAISWFKTKPERAPTVAQQEMIALYADFLQAGLARQAMIDAWKQQANRDTLTGLPNRRALMTYLAAAVERSRRQSAPLVVCLMDLDDFKPINDTYGHAMGDTVLMELAYRLKLVVRASDIVARLGGDEFVLVLENVTSSAQMETALERIHHVVAQPYILPGGKTVSVGMSMGLTRYPQDPADPDCLLKHADNALYMVKELRDKSASFWHCWQEGDHHLSEGENGLHCE